MLNIFFPIRYNNSFIFKKKIIIIYITQKSFSAYLIVAEGNKRIIEKNFYFIFENVDNIHNTLFISSLISKSILNWGHDYIKLILSSNLAIFKSLNSPFSDIEKLKMTIPFELESLLPFQLSEAAVDVIYQNKNLNNEKNKVLAIITKEEYLNFYREIFTKLNLIINSISIDTVEIIQYNLYYSNKKNTHLIIYNNNSGIVILLFTDHELITIKSLDLNLNLIDNNDLINNDHLNNNFYIINQILNSLEKEFNMSIKNIHLYIINIDKNNKLIQKLIDNYNFIVENLILDQENKYINNNIKINKNNENIEINNEIIYIFGSLFIENDIFNLGHKENTDFKNKILFKQIIAAIITTILLYIIILTYNILDLHHTNKQIKEAESKIIALLKNEFKLSNKYLNNIDNAFIESKKIVAELENNLPVLVTHNKFLFINLFSALVKNLSNEIKGLEINEMRWKLGTENPSVLTLIGSVNDFDSLHLLEESLKKSNLFLSIPQQQDLHFNFNLTILT